MPVIFQLVKPDLKFLSEQITRMVCAVAQDVVDAEELRLMIDNDAGIRRNGHLAVCTCVQSVYGLVWRDVIGQVDHDVGLVCRKVVNLLDLDLALFLSLDNGIDDDMGGLAERNFGNCQCILVNFLDLRTNLYYTAPFALHIFAAVSISCSREVRIKFEILALKMSNGGVDEFIEIMRENFRSETDCDTLSALCKQQRELDRKFHRLLITAVV